MAEPYIGEIRLFAGVRNEPPTNWSFCDGRLLSVAEYQPLYSLLGTLYGGDGVNTFGLPDYRSRLPVGKGLQGTSNYNMGATGGLEAVTLGVANMPTHTHSWTVSTTVGTQTDPTGNLYAKVPLATISGKPVGDLYLDTTATGFAYYNMDATMVSAAGTSPVIHENRMPSMAICFIIALQGIYPVQS